MLPLTSLVPTIVEITSFIEVNWPHVWWFPNWYLGVPLRFVTGPVVPLVVILLHRAIPLSLETLYIGLIGGIWGIGVIGVRVLVSTLGGGRRMQLWSCILFLLLPFHLLLLSISNGLGHITTGLLPWCFLVWQKFLLTNKKRYTLATVLGIALLLLINIGSILAIVVGCIGLGIMYRGERRFEEVLFKFIIIFLTSLSLATIWYTPRFWLTLLHNPSFAGKPLTNVIPFIANLAYALVPLVAAWWVVRRKHINSQLFIFGLLFFSSFFFLTFIRFLSDIDFWMDWVGYGLELQLGLAILVPARHRLLPKASAGRPAFLPRVRRKILISVLSTLGILGYLVIGNLFRASDRVYQNEIVSIVSEHVKEGERVFLSGSPVFWLGSKIPNLVQVRGGRDEVSTHPTWAMGAYQIREGEDGKLWQKWLQILGTSWILVNDTVSSEYFHDFKNLERFQDFEKVAHTNGNSLYRVNTIKESIQMVISDPTTMVFSILPSTMPEDVRAFATTYDSSWRIVERKGKIESDSFGNMAITPAENQTQFVLVYQEGAQSWIVPLLVSGVFWGVLIFSDPIIAKFRTFLPSFGLASEPEEE